MSRRGPSYCRCDAHSCHQAIERAIAARDHTKTGDAPDVSLGCDVEREVAAQHEEVGIHLHADAERAGLPDPSAALSVARARSEAHLDLHLAPHALGNAEDLMVRQQEAVLVLLGGNRHEIGDDKGTSVGFEPRLQDFVSSI